MITPTEQLKTILSNESFCHAIATHKDTFNATLYQIQLSLTTEENKDSIGSVILALKEIHEIFGDIILHGEATLAKKQKEKSK